MSSKKEALLITAERLFYSHGFHAIGLKAIVQEAGVALMTLYNHFDSKEELILEILDRREQTYLVFLEQAKNNEKGSIQKRLAVGHLQWLKNSASNGCMFLRAKEEFSNAPDQLIVQKVYSHKEKMLQFFQSCGLSPLTALQLSLLFEGATSLSETTEIEKIEDSFIPLVQDLKVG